MTVLELKIMAMQTLVETNLPKEKKLDLLNKLKESDGYQCMGFILDQKLYNLNEAGRKEIKRRFIKEEIMEEEEVVDEEEAVDEGFADTAAKIIKKAAIKSKDVQARMGRGYRAISKGYPTSPFPPKG